MFPYLADTGDIQIASNLLILKMFPMMFSINVPSLMLFLYSAVPNPDLTLICWTIRNKMHLLELTFMLYLHEKTAWMNRFWTSKPLMDKAQQSDRKTNWTGNWNMSRAY